MFLRSERYSMRARCGMSSHSDHSLTTLFTRRSSPKETLESSQGCKWQGPRWGNLPDSSAHRSSQRTRKLADSSLSRVYSQYAEKVRRLAPSPLRPITRALLLCYADRLVEEMMQVPEPCLHSEKRGSHRKWQVRKRQPTRSVNLRVRTYSDLEPR